MTNWLVHAMISLMQGWSCIAITRNKTWTNFDLIILFISFISPFLCLEHDLNYHSDWFHTILCMSINPKGFYKSLTTQKFLDPYYLPLNRLKKDAMLSFYCSTTYFGCNYCPVDPVSWHFNTLIIWSLISWWKMHHTSKKARR